MKNKWSNQYKNEESHLSYDYNPLTYINIGTHFILNEDEKRIDFMKQPFYSSIEIKDIEQIIKLVSKNKIKELVEKNLFVEISYNEDGKPYLTVSPQAKKLYKFKSDIFVMADVFQEFQITKEDNEIYIIYNYHTFIGNEDTVENAIYAEKAEYYYINNGKLSLEETLNNVIFDYDGEILDVDVDEDDVYFVLFENYSGGFDDE